MNGVNVKRIEGASTGLDLLSYQRKQRHKVWRTIEISTLVVIIFVVWALFSVPVIIYHLPVQRVSPQDSLLTSRFQSKSNVCIHNSEYLTAGDLCFQELEYVLTDSCFQELLGKVHVVQREEQAVRTLDQGLQSIRSTEDCRNEIFPFLCQYYYGLCSDSGILIPPTRENCDRIQSSACFREWTIASQFGIELPDCSILPPETSLCQSTNTNSSYTEESNLILGNNNSLKKSLNVNVTNLLECSPGFYRENGSDLCIPSCYTWTEYEPAVTTAIDIIIGSTAFAGFVAAITVIVISCIRHSRMFTFPSALIVCMVLDVFAFVFFLLIMYTDRPGLYCSSRNLLESIEDVTAFCVISGMLFSYVLLQISVWWLIHVITLLWKVLFPFHAQSFSAAGKLKRIYITSAIVGILFPVVPIVVSVSKFAAEAVEEAENGTSAIELFVSGGLGFSLSRFPPLLCTATDESVLFYSVVLPVDQVLAIGCSMLVIIFWSIHKHRRKKYSAKLNSPFQFGTAEKKLLVVIIYYIIMGTVACTGLTLSTRNITQSVQAIQLYFFCEQNGHDLDNPCSRDFSRYRYPSVTTLSYCLFSLFPVIHLIYAVNVKELKDSMQKLMQKLNIRYKSNFRVCHNK